MLVLQTFSDPLNPVGRKTTQKMADATGAFSLDIKPKKQGDLTVFMDGRMYGGNSWAGHLNQTINPSVRYGELDFQMPGKGKISLSLLFGPAEQIEVEYGLEIKGGIALPPKPVDGLVLTKLGYLYNIGKYFTKHQDNAACVSGTYVRENYAPDKRKMYLPIGLMIVDGKNIQGRKEDPYGSIFYVDWDGNAGVRPTAGVTGEDEGLWKHAVQARSFYVYGGQPAIYLKSEGASVKPVKTEFYIKDGWLASKTSLFDDKNVVRMAVGVDSQNRAVFIRSNGKVHAVEFAKALAEIGGQLGVKNFIALDGGNVAQMMVRIRSEEAGKKPGGVSLKALGMAPTGRGIGQLFSFPATP